MIDSVTARSFAELVPVPAGLVAVFGADVAPFGMVAVALRETNVTEGEVGGPTVPSPRGRSCFP